ncbi:MAG: hypothetical protein KIS87_01580 [Phycisphaeraceae bacterium]|nr:hypothetical protein [Phycisphaeraceae bacterium]
MNGSGTEILRTLGAGASFPVDVDVVGAPPSAGSEFAALLASAQSGELQTGLEVTVARGAGVQLSPSQLERLAVAADRAHAEGASRALVLIDGMALELDVLSRTITGGVDLEAEGVLTGIDAVVRVGAAGVPRVASFVPSPGIAPSLARALEESRSNT